MWLYRVLMLSWSLWLAFALLQWLRWGWSCYSRGGIWRKPPPLKFKPSKAPRKKKGETAGSAPDA
jgi:hypothetical protein